MIAGAEGIVTGELVPKLVDKLKTEHDEIKVWILNQTVFLTMLLLQLTFSIARAFNLLQILDKNNTYFDDCLW